MVLLFHLESAAAQHKCFTITIASTNLCGARPYDKQALTLTQYQEEVFYKLKKDRDTANKHRHYILFHIIGSN